MKKSFIIAGILGLFSAASAFANTNRHDLYRFDLNCTFERNNGCAAAARIFLQINPDLDTSNVSPEWYNNLLAVECGGELISASAATLRYKYYNGHIRWELVDPSGRVELKLFDRPFTGNHENVDAILKVGRYRIEGKCYVKATDVRGTQTESEAPLN